MSIEYENQLNNYIRMFENELRNLTATPNDWLKFLYSACHNYKLDFKELVLVNTTFPNSTAVLPKKAWVEKFGRMIDKNAVAIPSIVFNGSNSRVKLYYDISQTIETEKSKPVPLWKYDIKDEQSIVTALNKKFGLKAKSFETVIAGAINILAKSNSENNYQILKNVYRKATISRYDNARKIHSDIVAKSAMAVICSRCGFDITKIFNFGDFREVTYYDSSQAAVALGNATFGTAKSILQIISYTIQKERVLNNGKRNNNSLWSGVRQGQRGILDANSPTPEIGVEYVGNGKERISENEQSSRIRYDADVRGNLYPPRNNSDSGTGEVRNIDRAEERSIGSNRGTQGERLAQVGSVGERHSGRSSSGSSRRNDLHLNEENLKSNTEAEVIDNSSAFSISQEQINKIITEGSGVVNGKYRIYEQFAKDETLKDNAQFLKNEYGIDGVHQGYAKTKFIINMPDGTKYTERQDIGDGDGGVIDFLRQYDNYKNLVPILEQERDNEPSLLTPVYGEEFVKEVEEQSDNLSAQQKREDVIFSSDGKNYVITDDNFADGTKSERYANNINAIKTLKEIESSNRQATPAEQEILAKYVGWGGLDSYFKAENNAQLKALLNDDEYKAALASTLTSFYTPPAVIRAVYNALNNLGFKTGNILEPSCGVGNFMGLCPTNMSDSKFYGVELDDISGRIASKLYPQANIAVQGFETTNLPDNFFDAAVGNVPFAQLKVLDKKYDKYNFLIHDYFFAKTLDKVRPGGIIAFITSKGTMDKKSSKVRKYIAQRAELLGAIRLPNDTFSKTAGTEVTSDILILKKRERMIDIEPDWVHLGKDDNGITINSYFVEHPEMILGEMQEVSGPFGAKAECIAYENANLEDLLNEAVSNIDGEYKAQAIEKLFEDTEDDEDADLIPATPDVKNFSYTVVDGDIYYRQNSVMEKQKPNKTAEKRIKALVKVREALREVLNNQLEDMPDEIIANSQRKLNVIYDRFVNEYGYINSKANMKAFEKDNSINLLASLEKFDSEKNYKGKSDIFSKRTIKPHKAVDKVDTASDALAVSISEKAKIDLEYMSQLYGKSVDDIIDELKGVIFNVPGTDVYQTADEYLSGNVREKLRTALSYSYDKPEQYDSNITALKAVQPVDLTATEIDVRLGATWLPVDVVRDFMYETIGTPRYIRDSIDVSYSEYNSEWRISHKSFDKSVNAVSTYGTKRINAYKILEDTLNLRDVKIFDNVFEDGKEKRILNKEETAIAQSKQELIKSRFASWIFSDRDRRERLCRLYNEKFNSVRPREYDGSHLIFDGMNSEIQLREHQRNAVAHAIYGGNTLLAHTVGAGKTFEMVAIAMESKRLGLCNKSLFVVPNHITEQMGIEFMQLYPAANILVATKKDFETANRKKFCSRIATGDYDAVIIGHSQFEKIPMSIERQRQIIEMQIDDVIESIAFAQDNNAENFTIKQLEKTKKNLENKLQKLNDQSRKDDVVTFEELGVDRLFVDEAHYYKNLFLYTKMRNVAGVGQTEAQKSSDLFMKCRYLDEITDGKGVVFATGTPISNSMTELYTMQRYLQYNKLVDLGLSNFDAWASTFGETVTALELSPEGNGYRMKTRFAKFFNLPELMSTFREIADIKTADVLDLDVPEVERHNVLTKPSEQQKEIIAGIGDRADKVHSGDVDPSVDNMLKITNDGRKLALDQRLINPMLPDFEGSKLNVCADNIFSLWDKTKEDRLAQMVFCDISTPNGAGKFNVYDELKAKLIAKGIPENEIAFIHDAKTNQQKQDIFSQVRSGKIRVIIGSTSKMGAGTNCQDKLIALHHLDCPWRPSDLQQREGRIIRQGNKNSLVHIYSYLTENTFDAYLYQLVENKQKFISQIMTSKSPVRSAEDIDELQLSYAVAKALCSGNPLIKEKMDLDIEVSKLQLLKANFLSVKYELEDQIASTFPQKISSAKYNVEKIKSDIELAKSHINDDFALKIKGITYNDKKEAGQQLLLACDKSIGSDKVRIGEYKGFILDLRFDSYHSNKYILTLNGSAHYDVELGQDIFGNLTRIDNVLKSLPGELEKAKNELSKVESDCDSAKEAVNTTFDKEEELNTKLARLKELNAILEMDNSSNKANKKQDIVESSDDEYHYAKVNEKQKDILFSEGYKDFAPSDDGGKFIVKYPAADKVKVQQLLNNNAIKL